MGGKPTMTETTFKEKLKEAIPEMPESFHEIIEDTMKAICNDAYKQSEASTKILQF